MPSLWPHLCYSLTVAWSCSRQTKWTMIVLRLLLLSRFSRVRLCATPQTAAHQAPLSLGFSRQEHWSGLTFPFPMYETEKGKWSHSVMSDSLWPHGPQPTRLLHPWDFPGKRTGVGCRCLLHGAISYMVPAKRCEKGQNKCKTGFLPQKVCAWMARVGLRKRCSKF